MTEPLGPPSGDIAYFLGIDAGGSRCRSRLVDVNGSLLGADDAGPANAGLGRDQLLATVMAVAEGAYQQAGLDMASAAPLTSAGVGIAGLSRAGTRNWLDQADLPFGQISFATDAAIANLGAHRGEGGATLIVGTGSVALLDFDGCQRTLGGYGFPISDEGSGAALGLSAMRHALRALDGRTVMTPLSKAIGEQFDNDPVRAIGWMDQASPGDYARFAPLVFSHAEADDPIARSIVEDAARHIERFVQTIFEYGAPRCALMGGISRRIRPWLKMRTLDRLSEPEGDALDGALQLAGLPREADAS